MSGPQQIVGVAGTFSLCANITFGVSQGSILGNVLFLINVNGMSGLIDSAILLYVDASAILAVDKDISTVKNLLKTDHQILSG